MACCRVRQDMRSLSFEYFGRITRELRMPHRELIPILLHPLLKNAH